MSQDSVKKTYEMQHPDRQILFNCDSEKLKLCQNEKVLYTTRNVVDLKQTQNIIAQEVQGTLSVTTLRIVYHLDADITNNLSIGYQSVQKILVGNLNTVEVNMPARQTLAQQDKTLVLMCQERGAKYRFEFLPRGSKQIFDIVQAVYRAYDTSRGFRRIRTTVSNVLPGEFVEETFTDVASVSTLAPRPLPGALKLSNMRILWTGAAGVQLCIPYIDVAEVTLANAAELLGTENSNNRQQALVVTTTPAEDVDKGQKIGFLAFSANIDTLLSKLTFKIENAFQNPNYGVQISYNDDIDGMFLQDTQQVQVGGIFTQKFGKDVTSGGEARDLINQQARQARTMLTYLQAQNNQKDIVFDQELGLAFEKSDFNRTDYL